MVLLQEHTSRTPKWGTAIPCGKGKTWAATWLSDQAHAVRVSTRHHGAHVMVELGSGTIPGGEIPRTISRARFTAALEPAWAQVVLAEDHRGEAPRVTLHADSSAIVGATLHWSDGSVCILGLTWDPECPLAVVEATLRNPGFWS